MDDTISRQKARDFLYSRINSMPDEYYDAFSRVIDEMNNEPLEAEPQERETGQWLKISPAGIYECSECGKNVMTADIDAYDFCHGRGCRMMEVEQTND